MALKPTTLSVTELDPQQIASRVVDQVDQSTKYRTTDPTQEREFTARKKPAPIYSPHDIDEAPDEAPNQGIEYPAIWKQKASLTPTQLVIAHKLMGHMSSSTPLSAPDLYRAYKHSPQTPASVFLKYSVHRINHLDDYGDPRKAHDLDKQFLGLVQRGKAEDKNGHVSVSDLHGWTRRHAARIIPEILAIRDKHQKHILRGIGLNVRSINGQPHVALTRGLESDFMSDEHPLSSHADKPETGFGLCMHHSWVPVRDLWYSFDLGTKYSTGNMGPEDEYLISNTLPRYQATPNDVTMGRIKPYTLDSGVGVPESEYAYDSDTDQQLAAKVNALPADTSSALDGLLNQIYQLPNAGAAVYEAVKKKLPNFHHIKSDYYCYKWYPREEIMRDYGNVVDIARAEPLQNPNLTSQDLDKLSRAVLNPSLLRPESHPDPERAKRDVILEWMRHPSMTSHVLERTWKNTPSSNPLRSRLLESPLATPVMLQEVTDQIDDDKDNDHAVTSLLGVVRNPHHTEKHGQVAYDWAVRHGLFDDTAIVGGLHAIVTAAKLPIQTVRQMADKQDTFAGRQVLKRYVSFNPRAAPNIAQLAVEGKVSREHLNSRLTSLRKLESELQMPYLRMLLDGDVANIKKLKANVSGRDAYDVAINSSLTPESIRLLSHYPIKSVRNALFHNKSVLPEQIKEAFPKELPFPQPPTLLAPLPSTGDPIADEIAAAYYSRKAYEDQRNKKHLIKPLPPDLAKSDVDMWRAQVREWLADQEVKGYYLVVDQEHATNIVRDQAIEPQFTDRLLEGEAIFAHRASPVFIGNWHLTAHPDDVLVYFETSSQPQQQGDEYYWTARIPIENARIVDVATPLAKFQTPLMFPGLGISDDRRETKIIQTPTERKGVARAAAAQAVRENQVGDVSFDPQVNIKIANRAYGRYRKLVTEGSSPEGVTFEGVAGVGHPGFGIKKQDRERIPGAGSGQSAISIAVVPAQDNAGDKGVPATVVHENLHRIFSRVQHRHGTSARNTLATNLLYALPQDTREAISEHMLYQRTDLPPGPGWDEEALTMLGSYLNDPKARRSFHDKQQHSPEQEQQFSEKMKRAYKTLHAISGTVHEGWLHRLRPWLHKGQGEVPAHQLIDVDLGKSDSIGFILSDEKVFGAGEESAANMLLGHNKHHDVAVAAAMFLVGRSRLPDDDAFRTAMRVYDGDYESAALFSVGLTNSTENLRALRAAIELGEFDKTLSKSEYPTTRIGSVGAGTVDAQDTANQVARGVTAGLVRALHLRGKHSAGATAVRDPQTGGVWLLKPAANKPSPAKGIREDPSSQSEREAAFWHCAQVMGLERYMPRCDLLVVDGHKVAAIKLLGDRWHGLSERDKAVANRAVEILTPYLQRGDVHRFAIMDWVLGQVDRHGQNILTTNHAIALIDEGSTFAAAGFNPGCDTKSFVPYYLRVFAPSGFSTKNPDDRARGLPVLEHEVDAQVRQWVKNIDPATLLETMSRYGIGAVAQKAVLSRLDALQHATVSSISSYVNQLWCGVHSHD